MFLVSCIPEKYLNLVTLLVIALYCISMALLIISFSERKSLSQNYEYICMSIFAFASLSAVYLTILLVENKIPNYLNSIYILLGAIMVFSIDMLLNRKIEHEKDEKLKSRVFSVINYMLAINEVNLEKNQEILDKNIFGKSLEFLNPSFWDVLTENILHIDIEKNLLKRLFLIKEHMVRINSTSKTYNNFVEHLSKEKSFNDLNESELQQYEETIELIKEKLKNYNDDIKSLEEIIQ